MVLQSYLTSPDWRLADPVPGAPRPESLDVVAVDPDSGASIDPASPADAIRALQRALYVLGWATERFHEADRTAFVTGTWSVATVDAIARYQTAHAITYPPYEHGASGPRYADSWTLRWLEAHLRMLDGIRPVFRVPGVDDEELIFRPFADSDADRPAARALRGTRGAVCGGIVALDQTQWEGEMSLEVLAVHGPEVGRHLIFGRFLDAWWAHGGAVGLGFPLEDSPYFPGVQRFERGWLEGDHREVHLGEDDPPPPSIRQPLGFKRRDLSRPFELPEELPLIFLTDEEELAWLLHWNPLTDGDPEAGKGIDWRDGVDEAVRAIIDQNPLIDGDPASGVLVDEGAAEIVEVVTGVVVDEAVVDVVDGGDAEIVEVVTDAAVTDAVAVDTLATDGVVVDAAAVADEIVAPAVDVAMELPMDQ